jgi:hypothetical protein
LEDKVEGRKLTNAEKAQVQAELSGINYDFNKKLQEIDLKRGGDANPDLLKIIYSDLYEQGKILVRASDITALRKTPDELEKQ